MKKIKNLSYKEKLVAMRYLKAISSIEKSDMKEEHKELAIKMIVDIQNYDYLVGLDFDEEFNKLGDDFKKEFDEYMIVFNKNNVAIKKSVSIGKFKELNVTEQILYLIYLIAKKTENNELESHISTLIPYEVKGSDFSLEETIATLDDSQKRQLSNLLKYITEEYNSNSSILSVRGEQFHCINKVPSITNPNQEVDCGCQLFSKDMNWINIEPVYKCNSCGSIYEYDLKKEGN